MTRLAWGSATDVGRVRQNNEDQVFTSPTLFAVADGMGGHQGGEVASDVAVSSLRGEFTGGTPPTTWSRPCSWPTTPWWAWPRTTPS